ncbi:MAG: carotenoid biosynthesis protein [Planctomycetes bacterium]|nr:carotenoid biosynthesis protein [Planctomycetota bacterium]
MSAIEPFCFLIVALYVVVRAWPRDERRAVLLRLGLLALAAWIGELSCVRLYGFYRYTLPSEGGPWRLWLDVVPLVVVLTWPVVIHSAWELARSMATRSSQARVVLLCALTVLADASLIEPIAVAVGLWTWSVPGPFSVPPVGVLGWGLFAALAALGLEALERARIEGSTPWRGALLLIGAGLAVHVLLLAVWWGGLRYAPAPSEALALALVGLLSLVALALLARGPRADRAALWRRAPGACFFFCLLAWGVRSPWLWAWAGALALPYLVIAIRASSEPNEPVAQEPLPDEA